MIKLGNFVVMLLVMMVILQFIGIPTGAEAILAEFNIDIDEYTGRLINADLESSNFWKDIFNKDTGWLYLILGTVGIITIGFFARGYDTSLIILPLVVATAILFAGTFWSVMLYVIGLPDVGFWMVSLVATIFIGLGAAFTWSCVDYFAGR